MITKVLTPMTYVALQLLVNPPKMSTNSAVFASMVAQLTRCGPCRCYQGFPG